MHKRAWAILTIASLIVAMIAVAAFYTWENSALQSQHLRLQQQVHDLDAQFYYLTKGVNLTLADLQINDLSYMVPGVPALNIGGYMKNSGAGSASGVELQVTAQNQDSVLMNITVPYADYSVYEYNVDQEQHALLAAGTYSSYISTNGGPLVGVNHFNILAPADNLTVVGGYANEYFLLRIYHQNLFPNSTTYKLTPIWKATA